MAYKESVNRRQFLKRATGIVAGAFTFPYIVPSVLGRAGTVAPSNRIVMGAIGLGGQGMGDMQGVLHQDDVQVVAVCDVNKGSDGYVGGMGGREPARKIVEGYYAKRSSSGRFKGCAAYNDFRELIARDDIDAVTIAVPDHWHGLIAVMAVRAGKDIYGEKPLAYNIAEGRAIVDAVKRFGVVWQTGSHQRSERNFRFACELVRNGRIGNVHTVKVGLPNRNNPEGNPDKRPGPVPAGFDYDMWLGPAPWAPYSPARCINDFRWISDYSGGEITDWAGHHCDIAQWGMGTEHGSPVEIEGKGVFPKDKDGLFDTVENYRFVCKYAEGFTLIVAGEFPLGVRFEGSDGWVFVNRNGINANPKSLLSSVIGTNETHLYKSDDHVRNFLDCVRTRSQTVAPAEVAHRSIMIGHLGIIAIKTGRKLRWDPKEERFINDPDADRLLSRPMRSPWYL